MNFWLYILIFFGIFEMGISLGRNGERRGRYSFWTTFISISIELFLIIMAIRNGGF